MEQNRDQFIGLAGSVLCAVVLGSAVAVSRYAFDGGASGIVVAVFRSFFIVMVLAVGLKLLGRSFKIAPKLLPMAIFNGVLMGLMSYGNIGSVEFISIGLSSLLFFTFPIIIAVLVMVLRIEHVSMLKVFAMMIAFAGLAIMLGVSLGSVDGRGTALALMGSVATAVNAILVARHFRQVDVLALTLHFSAAAAVSLTLIAIFLAEVRLPSTPSGWGGMVGVAVFQSIGTPLYFFTISKIGALKTGMVTNIQPVTSIFEAWVLFDEVLSLLQAIGGAMVLFSIAFMQWVDFRRRPPKI